MREEKNIHSKNVERVFKNDFLERFTKTYFFVPVILYTLVSISLITYGYGKPYMSLASSPFIFIAGVFFFTLIEYLTHRYFFHLIPKTKKQEELVYKVHGMHHDYPKDTMRLVLPVFFSLPIATAFFFLFKLVMGVYVFSFFPGFIFGYAIYEFIHYLVHALRPPKNRFWKNLWINHSIHHYREPNKAYGLTSPLWDIVFQTMPRK